MTDAGSNPCFYVSVVDGPKRGFLAGPFRIHDSALALVERCRELAEKVDQWAHFYAFGTAKAPDGRMPGVLNDQVDYPELKAWEDLH